MCLLLVILLFYICTIINIVPALHTCKIGGTVVIFSTNVNSEYQNSAYARKQQFKDVFVLVYKHWLPFSSFSLRLCSTSYSVCKYMLFHLWKKCDRFNVDHVLVWFRFLASLRFLDSRAQEQAAVGAMQNLRYCYERWYIFPFSNSSGCDSFNEKARKGGGGAFEGREPFAKSKWLDKLCENTSFALHCTIWKKSKRRFCIPYCLQFSKFDIPLLYK